jgi:hypothetical protein
MKNELQERGSDTTVASNLSHRVVATSDAVTRRARLTDALILILLGAFAITQPILSDFRAGAGYFLAREARPLEIVLLVLLLTFVPGLVANVFVWAADAFSPKAREITHQVFIGLFVALVAQTVIVRFASFHWSIVMAGSVFTGALAVLAYRRMNWFKRFLTYLIPAPLIFVVLFLLTPPVSALVLPQHASESGVSVASESPVVFLVFDEFPVVSLLNAQGEIDADRYPNFARLASTSTWHRYTAAAYDYTWWAVPAILTGQIPETSRLPTAANYPGNLFSLYEDSGELHVVEPFTRLCSQEACGKTREPTTFGERFRTMSRDSLRLYDMMLRPNAERSSNFSDPFNEFGAGAATFEGAWADRTAPFTEFLNGISVGSGLHFAHLLLPHAPFTFYPTGVQYNGGHELPGHESEIWIDPVLTDQARQRHLLQIQAMDDLIGDLLNRLERIGVMDEALLVVTADHGISFQSGEPSRAITPKTAYEIGMVPLFIKAPYQDQGIIDSRPARTIDVLPTVASQLGIELPWKVDGQSLVGESRSEVTLEVRAKAGGEVAVNDPQEGVRAAVDRIYSTFGGDDESLDLFSLGGYGSIVGRPSVLLPTDSSGLVARVDEEWRFAHVTPEFGFLPGFVRGTVNGDVNENTHIAIALNGLVRTVVPIHDLGENRARFSAILPEEQFVSGFNDLDLFAVSGPENDPTVQTIESGDTRRFQLQKGADGQPVALSDSSGVSWEIVGDSAIRGAVDEAFWDVSEFSRSDLKDLHVAGWAVNEETKKPADQIVIFVNGVFAGSAGLDRERPDMQDAYQTVQLLFSGFRGSLSQFLPVASLDVSAYALSDGLAAELTITDEARADIAAG